MESPSVIMPHPLCFFPQRVESSPGFPSRTANFPEQVAQSFEAKFPPNACPHWVHEVLIKWTQCVGQGQMKRGKETWSMAAEFKGFHWESERTRIVFQGNSKIFGSSEVPELTLEI